MSGFDTAFDRLMSSEGGYTPGVGDPGGETKWGISKRSYPSIVIAQLTRDEAKEIYRKDYWLRVHADEMPPPIAFQVFDLAVNSGIETAVRMLQRALGVADDGHWGPVTQAAMLHVDGLVLALRLNGARLDYMTRLSGWQQFGKGWARRIAQNLLSVAEDVEVL